MIRPFTVVPVLNGYIVQVECQQLVFSTRDALLNAIGEYIVNPAAMEKHWLEKSINAGFLPRTPAEEPQEERERVRPPDLCIIPTRT